jgi:hypothetical protein
LLRNVILEEVVGNNDRIGGDDEHSRPKSVEIDESLFLSLNITEAGIFTDSGMSVVWSVEVGKPF